MASQTIDARALRDACGRFATGVTVVTTQDDEGAHGMTANAFMSVSLEPPLVVVSIRNSGSMLPRVRATGRYAVNILAEGMERVALHFGGRPDPGLGDLLNLEGEMPVVPGTTVQIVADVTQEVPAGDHSLLIGHVREIQHRDEAAPLLFHSGQFQSLKRGA